MSLHNLAQHLQGAGRNGDSVLVHMTPGEVKGLQALAMAHGGSLTINPQTGLPEAFFLASILPTIAGIGLKAAGFNALQSALITGAIGTLTSGSLSKGIMAGLGAFGGHGIGGALGAAGAAGAAAGLADDVAAAAATKGATNAATNLSSYTNPAGLGLGSTVSTGNVVNPTLQTAALTSPTAQEAAVKSAIQGGMKGDLVRGVTDAGLAQTATAPNTFGGQLSAMSRGLGEVTESPDKLFQFIKDNPYASAAVASSIYSGMQGDRKMPEQPKGKPIEVMDIEYDRPIGVAASRTSERDYFPRFRYMPTGRYYAARGGLMSLAEGGSVEEMSRMNAIGANTGYPMANQMSRQYATPAERPISQNVIRPMDYQNIDPYTGEQRFAEGGTTSTASTAGGSVTDTSGNIYTKYTGEGKPSGDDYYYVTGSMAGPGYYMVKSGTQAPAGAESFQNFQFNFDPTTQSFAPGRVENQQVFNETPVNWTQQTLDPLYQRYFGRNVDPAGLAAYTAKPFSEKQLNQFFTTSPEYAAMEPIRAARERETQLASPSHVADIYERKLGRQPDLPGLEYYSRTQRVTPGELEAIMKQSPEYFTNLTKPLVSRINYDQYGLGSIEDAPVYNPAQYGYPGNIVPKIGPPFPSLFQTVAPTGTPGPTGTPFPTGTPSPTGTSAPTTTPAPTSAAGGLSADQINQIYQTVFGRSADQAALSAYGGQKDLTTSRLSDILRDSPESKIRSLYSEVLGRTGANVDDAGLTHYINTIGKDNIITADERNAFVQAAQPELKIQGLFDKYLKTRADTNQLSYWVPYIAADNVITPAEEQLFINAAKNSGQTLYNLPTTAPTTTPAPTAAPTVAPTTTPAPTVAPTTTPKPTTTVAPTTTPAPTASPFLSSSQIDTVFRNVFGRPADSAALSFYGSQSGLTSSQLSNILSSSDEQKMRNLYSSYLGRTGTAVDDAGLNWWMNTILKDQTSPGVITQEELKQFVNAAVDAGELPASRRMAMGGLADLGGYSDGGRLLKGPGDGVSDSIPAVIGQRQPARLADGEFVIPARIVSELGNGSTDAGARKLYAMMDRIQRARRKSVGKNRVAVNSRADKHLPA